MSAQWVCPVHGPQDRYVAAPGSVLPVCPTCGRLVVQVEDDETDEAF